MNQPFRCDVCGSEKHRVLLTDCQDLYSGFPGRFQYVQCLDCQLVQEHPVPENIGSFYERYQVHQKKGRLHEFMRWLLMSHAYYPCDASIRGRRVLDFGSGDGWFLGRAHQAGAVCNGFEINPEHAATLAASLHLPVHSTWEELEKAGPFDVITMHFVLEHLRDAPQLIKRLGSLLAPGGKLYGIVPSIHSWEFKVFGKLWHGLDAPRHLIFPDETHLSRIAREAQLTLIESRQVAIPSSLAGTLASLGKGGFSYKRFTLAIPMAWLFGLVRPKGNWCFILQSNAR